MLLRGCAVLCPKRIFEKAWLAMQLHGGRCSRRPWVSFACSLSSLLSSRDPGVFIAALRRPPFVQESLNSLTLSPCLP